MVSLNAIPIKHPFVDAIIDFGIPLGFRAWLPATAMIFMVVTLIGIYLQHYTRFGRNAYAIGSNEQSAVLMGLPVGRTKILIYTFNGLLCALAGIVYSLYTLSRVIPWPVSAWNWTSSRRWSSGAPF